MSSCIICCLHLLFVNSDLITALERYREVESVKLGRKQSTECTRTEKKCDNEIYSKQRLVFLGHPFGLFYLNYQSYLDVLSAMQE